MERARKKAQRDARHAREATKLEELRVLMERDDVRTTLNSEPHPLDWRAEKGDTLLDWATWMLENSGNSGKLKVLKKVKALASGRPSPLDPVTVQTAERSGGFSIPAPPENLND